MAISPMMRQYLEIKEQHPDCVLFFRLGDFYETFFEDAELSRANWNSRLRAKIAAWKSARPCAACPITRRTYT